MLLLNFRVSFLPDSTLRTLQEIITSPRTLVNLIAWLLLSICLSFVAVYIDDYQGYFSSYLHRGHLIDNLEVCTLRALMRSHMLLSYFSFISIVFYSSALASWISARALIACSLLHYLVSSKLAITPLLASQSRSTSIRWLLECLQLRHCTRVYQS